MLFWRVYDQTGREQILNLERVERIIFPEEGSNSKVVVGLSSGEFFGLADNSERRQLVDNLILDASKVDRQAINEAKKSPERRRQKEARAFWAAFPRRVFEHGRDSGEVWSRGPLAVNVRLVAPEWAKKLARKARRIRRLIGVVR